MEKYWELLWNQGAACWVYDVYHCTEKAIRERAERYSAQSTHGIYYTYREV